MGALISFYISVIASIRGTAHREAISSVSLSILLIAYYPLKMIQSRVYYAVYQNLEVTNKQLIFLSFILAHMDVKFSAIYPYYNVSHSSAYCRRFLVLISVFIFSLTYTIAAGVLDIISSSIKSQNDTNAVDDAYYILTIVAAVFLLLKGLKEAMNMIISCMCANCCKRTTVQNISEMVDESIAKSKELAKAHGMLTSTPTTTELSNA